MRTVHLILLLALTPLCAVAQVPAQSVARPAPAGTPATGAITGRVLDERGQPLTNAVVTLRTVGAGAQPQNMTTDREGAFNFRNLDRASYLVTATSPAYTQPPVDPVMSQTPNYHIGDSVTLTLVKGGVITGAVTNLAGEPIVGVGVRVQMLRDANGRRTSNSWNQLKLTDDRGVYRAYGLPTGTYVVLAGGPSQYYSMAGYPFDNDVPTYAPASTRDTAAEVSVRAGEEIAGIDIRYRGEQGRIVSGQVNVPPEFAPGSNVTLTAMGDTGVPWSSTEYQQPNSRGFVFNAVADGDYSLVAQSYGPNGDRAVSVAKRIKVRGADVTGIELSSRPLSSVAGRVVLEESKAPECTEKPRPVFNEMLVSAWHNDNDAAKEMPQFVWSIGAPVSPDAEGNFTLRNLAPAEYYFIARQTAKYWYLQSITFAPTPVAGAKVASKPIDATRVWTNIKPADKLSGLTITIAQGAASLRGNLALGEGEQVPARLFVYLVPAERERAEDVLRYFAAPVSPEGKITLNNIAPGRYWILTQTVSDDTLAPLAKLRLPLETETRARFRREAEAAKTEIEFKPCQNVTDFQLPLKPAQP
ncbi:MAG TPA: carboxypeptidase-like regulatory domain-containing protein [Pyrinomonadaceae bacterium]|jgi:hypothetical protein